MVKELRISRQVEIIGKDVLRKEEEIPFVTQMLA